MQQHFFPDDSFEQAFQRIFFDTRFSINGEVSCGTCHKPELMFTDGLARSEGVGTTVRGTQTIIGTAYNPWFFWDGRADSLWGQALAPMESLVEHGGTRTQYVHVVDEDPIYRAEYESLCPIFRTAAVFPM